MLSKTTLTVNKKSTLKEINATIRSVFIYYEPRMHPSFLNHFLSFEGKMGLTIDYKLHF